MGIPPTKKFFAFTLDKVEGLYFADWCYRHNTEPKIVLQELLRQHIHELGVKEKAAKR